MKEIFVGIIGFALIIAILVFVVGLLSTVLTSIVWCVIAFIGIIFGTTVIPFYWIWQVVFLIILVAVFIK